MVGTSQGDFYQSYVYPFIVSTISRVSVSETQYKFAIVTFDERAMLNVKLRTTNVSYIYSQLSTNATGGRGNNLRQALYVARTQALSIDNGMRPLAYQAVIVLWDGRAPDREFGTLVDEAPRLRTMLGADVYVGVKAEYEYTSMYLVENIASQPHSTHTRLVSPYTVEDDVSSILVNIQLHCQSNDVVEAADTVSQATSQQTTVTPAFAGNATVAGGKIL